MSRAETIAAIQADLSAAAARLADLNAEVSPWHDARGATGPELRELEGTIRAARVQAAELT